MNMSEYLSQSKRRVYNRRYLIDEYINCNPGLQEAAYEIVQYEHLFTPDSLLSPLDLLMVELQRD